MKFPYDNSYQPPMRVVQVTFHNDPEGRRTAARNALLDTGSDGSLVPIALLREIYAPALADTHIRSHWGEWRSAQMFLVDVELNEMRLPG